MASAMLHPLGVVSFTPATGTVLLSVGSGIRQDVRGDAAHVGGSTVDLGPAVAEMLRQELSEADLAGASFERVVNTAPKFVFASEMHPLSQSVRLSMQDGRQLAIVHGRAYDIHDSFRPLLNLLRGGVFRESATKVRAWATPLLCGDYLLSTTAEGYVQRTIRAYDMDEYFGFGESLPAATQEDHFFQRMHRQEILHGMRASNPVTPASMSDAELAAVGEALEGSDLEVVLVPAAGRNAGRLLLPVFSAAHQRVMTELGFVVTSRPLEPSCFVAGMRIAQGHYEFASDSQRAQLEVATTLDWLQAQRTSCLAAVGEHLMQIVPTDPSSRTKFLAPSGPDLP